MDDARYIDEIVYESRDVTELPLDECLRPAPDGRVFGPATQELKRILEGCEGAPQFVPKDCKELVLSPVGGGELFPAQQ
jgi:hypothetical protein